MKINVFELNKMNKNLKIVSADNRGNIECINIKPNVIAEFMEKSHITGHEIRNKSLADVVNNPNIATNQIINITDYENNGPS